MDKEREEKKYRGIAGGDYTTGVNDTFACCRSDMLPCHLWNSFEWLLPLDGLTIRDLTYFSYKNNDRLM